MKIWEGMTLIINCADEVILWKIVLILPTDIIIWRYYALSISIYNQETSFEIVNDVEIFINDGNINPGTYIPVYNKRRSNRYKLEFLCPVIVPVYSIKIVFKCLYIMIYK